MTTVELKKNLKKYLDMADAGDVLKLTRSGKVYEIKRI